MRCPQALALLFVLLVPGAFAQSGSDSKDWPKTDFSRRTVELSEIESGGPPKDGIPAIEKHGIINDELAGKPVVILSRPGLASPLDDERIERGRSIPAATAFSRRLGTQVLEFALRDAKIVDTASGSDWNLFGEAVAGRFKGRRLDQLYSGVHFAFAWLAFNPDSDIWRGR